MKETSVVVTKTATATVASSTLIHPLIVKADRKGNEWVNRIKMRGKLLGKRARYFNSTNMRRAKRRSLSSEEEIITTKEDSSMEVSKSSPSNHTSTSSPPLTSQTSSSRSCCSPIHSSNNTQQISEVDEVEDTESERLDAYDEFFNDLQNEANIVSDESIKEVKKDGYYFDDDFKLSQIDEKSPVKSPVWFQQKPKGSRSPKKSNKDDLDEDERNIYDYEEQE